MVVHYIDNEYFDRISQSAVLLLLLEDNNHYDSVWRQINESILKVHQT